MYDNIKEGAYKLYDGVVGKVKEIGKAMSQELKYVKNVAGDIFKDTVETIPKLPKFGFGW